MPAVCALADGMCLMHLSLGVLRPVPACARLDALGEGVRKNPARPCQLSRCRMHLWPLTYTHQILNKRTLARIHYKELQGTWRIYIVPDDIEGLHRPHVPRQVHARSHLYTLCLASLALRWARLMPPYPITGPLESLESYALSEDRDAALGSSLGLPISDANFLAGALRAFHSVTTKTPVARATDQAYPDQTVCINSNSEGLCRCRNPCPGQWGQRRAGTSLVIAA